VGFVAYNNGTKHLKNKLLSETSFQAYFTLHRSSKHMNIIQQSAKVEKSVSYHLENDHYLVYDM